MTDEQMLLQRAGEGSLSNHSRCYFTHEQELALKRLIRHGEILKVGMPCYSGAGNRYRYILPFKGVK